jgi:fumarate hydratase subunit beta
MSAVQLTTPLNKKVVAQLKAGDGVLISGEIYTARDAAHERLMRLDEAGAQWPFDTAGAVIYYAGPAPAPPGFPIGSVGPTTSYRMDPYLKAVLSKGVLATIGKGDRSEEVRDLCVEYGAVYLVAVGGAGALLAERVVSSEVIAFPELGPEAITRLTVKDFPAIVAYDIHGGNVFDEVVRYTR